MRLSFITQLNTELLLPFTGCRKVLGKIAFTQNSFVISPGLLYHLIRRDTGGLGNEAFTSDLVSSKQ